VICTFQAPSNVAAADGVAKPSAASIEAVTADIRDFNMTCPFWFGHEQGLTSVP
jgi:hypothetical protein